MDMKLEAYASIWGPLVQRWAIGVNETTSGGKLKSTNVDRLGTLGNSEDEGERPQEEEEKNQEREVSGKENYKVNSKDSSMEQRSP